MTAGSASTPTVPRARVIAGMTMSLDGFASDARGSASALYADLNDWRQSPRGRASIAATGAVLMGRRTFEMAADPDSYAEHYEYQVPIFVVTSQQPLRHPREHANLRFTFATNGLASAVHEARVAAGDKQLTVVGGAALIQSLIRSGDVDELEVDVMPLLLGDGLRLLDNLGSRTLERIEVEALPYGRTALRYALRG